MKIRLAIPVLHVSSAKRAEDFYCDRLGFRRQFAYRVDESKAARDGVEIHLSSFPGDGVCGGVVNFVVDDVDALHAELVAKQIRIDTGPLDETWGTREMYVKDDDGNSVRFQQLFGSWC